MAGILQVWSIRMNRSEPEGISVWEGCPFVDGTLVYLQALIVPRMAVRIGGDLVRDKQAAGGGAPLSLPGRMRWLNSPLLQAGPWPRNTVPVRVGCNLNVIPAWERVFAPMTAIGDLPVPTHASMQGVDCTTVDELEVWAAVAPGTTDQIRGFPWVRHPSGFWAQPAGSGAAASGPAHRFIVPCRDADRVYCQVEYTTTFTAGGGVLYGRMTPPPEFIPGTSPPVPAPETNIRFGAVLYKTAEEQNQ